MCVCVYSVLICHSLAAEWLFTLLVSMMLLSDLHFSAALLLYYSPRSSRSRCPPAEGWCSSTPRCCPCGSAAPLRAPRRTAGCQSISAGWDRAPGTLLPVKTAQTASQMKLMQRGETMSSDKWSDTISSSSKQPTHTHFTSLYLPCAMCHMP